MPKKIALFDIVLLCHIQNIFMLVGLRNPVWLLYVFIMHASSRGIFMNNSCRNCILNFSCELIFSFSSAFVVSVICITLVRMLYCKYVLGITIVKSIYFSPFRKSTVFQSRFTVFLTVTVSIYFFIICWRIPLMYQRSGYCFITGDRLVSLVFYDWIVNEFSPIL